MAEVKVSDILLRVGGRTLHRTGVLAAAGAGRGYVEVPYTFTRADASTCATLIDRDGILRLAAADKLRIEYPPEFAGLVDAAGLPFCGPSLHGSRINLVENGNYEADAVGSTLGGGSTIARDNAQAKFGSWSLKVTTANALGSGVFWTKRDGNRMAAAASNIYTKSLWVYAPAASVGKTMRFQVEWWNATPALIQLDPGPQVVLVAGWQRVNFRRASPTGTVTARTFWETDAAQGVFDVWVDLVQFEAGAFESSAIPTGTAAVTRAADSLTVPFNFGPTADITILARIARTSEVSAIAYPIFRLGTVGTVESIEMDVVGATFEAVVRDPAGGFQAYLNGITIPATAEQAFCLQAKNLTTAPAIAADTGNGAGMSAFDTSSVALTKYGNQVLDVGGRSGSGTEKLFSVLLDLIVFRGLFTRAECLAAP